MEMDQPKPGLTRRCKRDSTGNGGIGIMNRHLPLTISRTTAPITLGLCLRFAISSLSKACSNWRKGGSTPAIVTSIIIITGFVIGIIVEVKHTVWWNFALQKVRDDLLRFDEDLDQVASNIRVLVVVERGS